MPLLSLAALLAAAASAAQTFCPLDGPTVRRIVSCKSFVSLQKCRAVAERSSCHVIRELPSINAVVIEVSESRAVTEDGRLRGRSEIERVDEDKRVQWLQSVDLPKFKRSAASEAEPAMQAELPWGVRRVEAPAIWERGMGEGVKIAVIDTGIDATHPDLKGRVAGGVNLSSSGKAEDWKDAQGHGTHVAGIIGAARDGQGVAGAAPKAALYAVKVLADDGTGGYSEIIAGIEWAVQNRMQIANLSLGADEGSEPLRKAVAAARKAGLFLVAAAGNNDGGALVFPGAYEDVVAVAASNEKDGWADFSSVGPEVDFIAPGDTIKSSVAGGYYAEMSGTSMAAPHVAALAALAVERGAKGPDGILSALKAAASPLPKLPPEKQGLGLPSASRLGVPAT